MESNSLLEKKEFALKSASYIRPIDTIVILSSLTALYLFRLQDGHQLNPNWQLKRPSNSQHIIHAPPLITDIDGNGLKELIIASEDRIEIFSYQAREFHDEDAKENSNNVDDTTKDVLYHLHLTNELPFDKIVGADNTVMYPVAMNAGCMTGSHKAFCSQAVAIVWSDWTVTMLSDKLKLLWKSTPLNTTFNQKMEITEMSVLVGNVNNTNFGENGIVIVGGVLNLKEHNTNDSLRHDHSVPTVPSGGSDEISQERAGVEPNRHSLSHDLPPDVAKYTGHFTTYALDGKTGEIKWKHEPGDFEEEQEHDKDKLAQLHFKLHLKKKRLHLGEVHWKKYSSSFLSSVPYSWNHYTDTDITTAYFERSLTQKSKQKNDSAKQLLKLARRSRIGKQTAAKNEENANVVVLRHQHAIEILSLEDGSPVCVLPLDRSKHSTVGDVNGDEIIDTVKINIYQENLSTAPTCFIVVTDGLDSSVHFNSSICDPSSMFSFFEEVDKPEVNHGVKLTSLAPLLIRPLQRSSGVFHHILGYGLSHGHIGLESLVLLSSGKLTAIGPSGRLLWQVDIRFSWSKSESENNFFPSIKPISLSSEGMEDAVLILGPQDIFVISLVDGSLVSTHSLPCHSTQPLVSGDINNDISEEFLVRCSDRYLGFSLERYSRIGLTLLLYSGIACLVAFLLLIIKSIVRDEFPVDTLAHVTQGMKLIPTYGSNSRF